MVLNEILAQTLIGARQEQIQAANRLYDLLESNDFSRRLAARGEILLCDLCGVERDLVKAMA